jgi:hypothetical protein
MIRCKHSIRVLFPLLLSLIIFLPGCYSFKVGTHAQAGAGGGSVKAAAYFWGLAKSPKQITTPACDSLGAYGVSEVKIKKNFGQTIMSLLTLGIYSPATIEWKCSKTCPKEGGLGKL